MEPVWIELVVPLDVPVVDGKRDYPAAAAAAIRQGIAEGWQMIAARPPSEVSEAMTAHAAEVLEAMADARHAVKVARGAVENGVYADPTQIVNALRSIEAMLEPVAP